MKLPKGYKLATDHKPINGEEVMVITSKERCLRGYYQSFLGNELWETCQDVDENETVIGWRSILEIVLEAADKRKELIEFANYLTKECNCPDIDDSIIDEYINR